MGGIFSSPKPPGPDPELARMRAEQEAQAAKDKQTAEDKAAEEEASRKRNRVGRGSLLSGSETGFTLGGGSTLG
jgi:hypothetical protein